MSHGDNLKASLTSGLDYERTHIVPDNEKNQALAAIHSQTLQAKNTLKYYYDFYLQTTFKFTSWVHLREYSIYVFVQIDTLSIRTLMGGRNYQWSNTILQRAAFNPDLLRTFPLRHDTRYRIPSAPVHHSRVVTLRRVQRRATLDRWGRLVSSY